MARRGGSAAIPMSKAAGISRPTHDVLLSLVNDELLPQSMQAVQQSGIMKAVAPGVIYDQSRAAGALYGRYSQGMEKPLGTPNYDFLRAALDISTIDKTIIAARQFQLRHVMRLETPSSNSIGVTIRHRDWDDPAVNTDTPQIRERCMYALDVLNRFDRHIHRNFTAYATSTAEDLLAYDRHFIVKEHNYKGEPTNFWSLDPITIRPVLEALLPLAQIAARKLNKPVPSVFAEIEFNAALRDKMLEQLSEQLRVSTGRDIDLTKAAYVQVINGINIVGAWAEDECGICVLNPQNRLNFWGYGRSPLEISLELTDLLLSAWGYNKNLFNQDYPERLLVIGGGYDQKALESFKNMLKSAGKGQDKRLGVVSWEEGEAGQSVATAANVIPLRESPRDMAFMEMITLLINLKCAAFSMHPSTINIRESSGQGMVFEQSGSQEQKLASATEAGLHSLIFSMCRWLTEELITPIDDELQVVPINLEKDSKTAEAQLLQTRESMTVNEKRIASGQKPLPKADPRGDMLCSQVGVAIDSAIAQQQMMEMQMLAGPEQAAGGAPAGNGGAPPPQPAAKPAAKAMADFVVEIRKAGVVESSDGD